jgi:hypothetical protein
MRRKSSRESVDIVVFFFVCGYSFVFITMLCRFCSLDFLCCFCVEVCVCVCCIYMYMLLCVCVCVCVCVCEREMFGYGYQQPG